MSPAAWIGGGVVVLTGLVTLWAWWDEWRHTNRLRQQQKGSVLECVGGPKDGEEVWCADRFPVYALTPLVLSPHGRADREDELKGVLLGVYHRQGNRLVWRPA